MFVWWSNNLKLLINKRNFKHKHVYYAWIPKETVINKDSRGIVKSNTLGRGIGDESMTPGRITHKRGVFYCPFAS